MVEHATAFSQAAMHGWSVDRWANSGTLAQFSAELDILFLVSDPGARARVCVVAMIVRLSTVVRPVTEKSGSEARMSIIRVAIKTLSTMAAA